LKTAEATARAAAERIKGLTWFTAHRNVISARLSPIFATACKL
jgi:hypothetical protein